MTVSPIVKAKTDEAILLIKSYKDSLRFVSIHKLEARQKGFITAIIPLLASLKEVLDTSENIQEDRRFVSREFTKEPTLSVMGDLWKVGMLLNYRIFIHDYDLPAHEELPPPPPPRPGALPFSPTSVVDQKQAGPRVGLLEQEEDRKLTLMEMFREEDARQKGAAVPPSAPPRPPRSPYVADLSASETAAWGEIESTLSTTAAEVRKQSKATADVRLIPSPDRLQVPPVLPGQLTRSVASPRTVPVSVSDEEDNEAEVLVAAASPVVAAVPVKNEKKPKKGIFARFRKAFSGGETEKDSAPLLPQVVVTPPVPAAPPVLVRRTPTGSSTQYIVLKKDIPLIHPFRDVLERAVDLLNAPQHAGEDMALIYVKKGLFQAIKKICDNPSGNMQNFIDEVARFKAEIKASGKAHELVLEAEKLRLTTSTKTVRFGY